MGDMSLVGPRPEVRKYVEMFRDDYADDSRVSARDYRSGFRSSIGTRPNFWARPLIPRTST